MEHGAQQESCFNKSFKTNCTISKVSKQTVPCGFENDPIGHPESDKKNLLLRLPVLGL